MAEQLARIFGTEEDRVPFLPTAPEAMAVEAKAAAVAFAAAVAAPVIMADVRSQFLLQRSLAYACCKTAVLIEHRSRCFALPGN